MLSLQTELPPNTQVKNIVSGFEASRNRSLYFIQTFIVLHSASLFFLCPFQNAYQYFAPCFYTFTSIQNYFHQSKPFTKSQAFIPYLKLCPCPNIYSTPNRFHSITTLFPNFDFWVFTQGWIIYSKSPMTWIILPLCPTFN